MNSMLDKSRKKQTNKQTYIVTLSSLWDDDLITSDLDHCFPVAFDGSLLLRMPCFKQWIIIRYLEWYYQRHGSWFCSPIQIASLIFLLNWFESLSSILAPSQSMAWFSWAIWSNGGFIEFLSRQRKELTSALNKNKIHESNKISLV